MERPERRVPSLILCLLLPLPLPPMPLVGLLFAAYCVMTVTALQPSDPQQRLAIERRTALIIAPSQGEPKFTADLSARGCLLNRNDGDSGGGFKLTMPPHTRGEKEFMNGLRMPAKLLPSGELECLVHPVITTVRLIFKQAPD